LGAYGHCFLLTATITSMTTPTLITEKTILTYTQRITSSINGVTHDKIHGFPEKQDFHLRLVSINISPLVHL
jgi:hypothetical protein